MNTPSKVRSIAYEQGVRMERYFDWDAAHAANHFSPAAMRNAPARKAEGVQSFASRCRLPADNRRPARSRTQWPPPRAQLTRRQP
jgi:hypothetical protein